MFKDIFKKERDSVFGKKKNLNPFIMSEEDSRKYEEQQRKENEEKLRLEAMPPLYIVHTVHGTFASKAVWIQPESYFCRELKSRLGYRVEILPFIWRDCNSVKARFKAAESLRIELKKNFKIYPDAHHIIISHSHGGNVAFMAVDSEELSKRLLGVVTLATPFLSAEKRHSRKLIDAGTGFFAGLFAGWAVLFYGLYKGSGWDLLPLALGVAALTIILLKVGAWIIDKMEDHAENIFNMMPGSKLTSGKTAIIRLQGDEASAAISGARLAGTLSSLVWYIATAKIFERLNNLLRFWNYGKVRSTEDELEKNLWKKPADISGILKPEPIVIAGEKKYIYQNPAIIPQNLNTKMDDPLLKQILQISVQGIALFIMTILQDGGPTEKFITMLLLGIYGLPAAISLMMVILGIPFGILSSISLIPCGLTVPLAGPYLDLSAETSPAGSWTVTQFKSDSKTKSLFHSGAYRDLRVISFISDWIKEKSNS